MHVCWVASVMSNSLRPHGLQPTRLPCPWDCLGKNTGAGFHFLLQGIILTQGSNPHLLNWQVVSLPLSHQGSPENEFNEQVIGIGSHRKNIPRENKIHRYVHHCLQIISLVRQYIVITSYINKVIQIQRCFRVLSQFTRPAITKYHRPGCLKDRTLFSHVLEAGI